MYDACTRKRYTKRDHVMVCGEDEHFVVLLLHGEFRITDEHGRMLTVIRGPTIVGEAGFAHGRLRTSDVYAMCASCDAMILTTDVARTLVAAGGGIAKRLLQMLERRASRSELVKQEAVKDISLQRRVSRESNPRASLAESTPDSELNPSSGRRGGGRRLELDGALATQSIERVQESRHGEHVRGGGEGGRGRRRRDQADRRGGRRSTSLLLDDCDAAPERTGRGGAYSSSSAEEEEKYAGVINTHADDAEYSSEEEEEANNFRVRSGGQGAAERSAPSPDSVAVRRTKRVHPSMERSVSKHTDSALLHRHPSLGKILAEPKVGHQQCH